MAKVGSDTAFAEGDQRLDIDAHAAGEANENLEVGLDAGAVGGLLDELYIAEGVGDGAGFFVKTGGREDNVGEGGGFGGVGYLAGLGTTIGVMNLFNAAQPALLPSSTKITS